ncbi:MAG TPA: TIGR01459 family HAD-type hydrolase [Thermohalobaculum sp.]|nr:TIGR01459 family HAD-type hydrolase [Thermohalobaculum sp.]
MTCRIIQSLAEIGDRYQALFVDLWGCYHNGIATYPAAVDALHAYRKEGGIVILLTNAPRPAASVKTFLDRIGAPADSYDGIMSSGAACQRALASGDHGSRFHYVGPPRDLHMLTGLDHADAPLDQADAILCTGLRDDLKETPDDYIDAMVDWRARGLTLLCANPDLIVDRGEQRLYCAGSLALAYEKVGGKVVWFGKPHGPTYDQSFHLLEELTGREISPDAVLAIGDGIRTDVKGGLDAGLDVLFVAGGLSAADLGTDAEHPDPLMLSAYLKEHGVAPQYAIGRLR